MSLSICICTFNRCEELKLTLDSIFEHRGELRQGDEIVVIDNNSTDQTKMVVSQYFDKLPIHYYFEKRQGHSAARNKALSEFKNDKLIFTDDDVTLAKGFINGYRHAFKNYTKKAFFGGKIHIDWGGEPPRWYKSNKLPLINGLLVYYDQGDLDKDITESDLLPYGANFALRRELVEKVGLFNEDVGNHGNVIGRGDETEYMSRAFRLGFSGTYVSSVLLYHRFNADRISINYLYRFGISKGIAAVKIGSKKPEQQIGKVTYQIFAGFLQLLKLRKDRFYQCVINIGIQRGIHSESKNVYRAKKNE